MSGLLRNIERGRERRERATKRCVNCGRLRRPDQVWQPLAYLGGDVCISEATCIVAAKERTANPVVAPVSEPPK